MALQRLPIVLVIGVMCVTHASCKLVNVALGKDIRGRGRAGIENLLDGDPETCRNSVNLRDDTVTIDLSKPFEIGRVKLYLDSTLTTDGKAKIRAGNSTRSRKNPICTNIRKKGDKLYMMSNCDAVARYITVQKIKEWGSVSLCEIELYAPACEYTVHLTDVSKRKLLTETSEKTARGVDGSDVNTGVALAPEVPVLRAATRYQPSWKVDLEGIFDVYQVVIFKTQECWYYPIMDVEIRVGVDDDFAKNPVCREAVEWKGRGSRREKVTYQCGCETPMKGRYVSGELKSFSRKMFHLCGLKVMALT